MQGESEIRLREVQDSYFQLHDNVRKVPTLGNEHDTQLTEHLDTEAMMEEYKLNLNSIPSMQDK